MTYQDGRDSPKAVKLTVDDYVRLGDAGAFVHHPRTELIDGTILAMNAAYSRHARVQSDMFRAIDAGCRQVDAGLTVLIEPSILLDRFSLPQPDLAIVRAIPDDGPLPLGSVAVIVEVSDSSREYDLGAKALLYAGARIEEYWVADVGADLLHQMWRPGPQGYGKHRRIAFGTRLDAVTVPLAIDLPPG